MAASKPSSRYAAVEPCSSSSSRGPSPASRLKSTSKKLPSLKNLSSNSGSRRDPSHPTAAVLTADNSSRVLAKKNPLTFGTIVKNFMEKRSNSKCGSAKGTELVIPPDTIAEDLKKATGKGSGSGFSSLHRKLFNRSGSLDRTPKNALTEVNNNTRTLGMVLRSERELMSQNKEYEKVIADLRLLVEEKNLEVDKLKDLCLKQREEIKALKDAVLFPDVLNPQLQELFERQGSEFKEARKIIPCLQKQVSSLTGKIQCLAVDLAEVKADKYVAKNCFDRLANSPTTPEYEKEFSDALEYNSCDPLRIDDINPCLTPCFSKVKSKGYREVGYNSPGRNRHFEDNSDLEVLTDSYGGMLSRSSEHYQKQSMGINSSRKICMSDESKWRFGKQKPQNLF
ncbi:uncharacterized protein LOC110032485 [Phalaenopsis equestris]|uniref:uncharacterized protein LOC110032485 n=1 Tax=Phalaenopsis equestris TaxID=78828 RepID=UPI0009E43CA8|nr:uncharacterized protein LOC110032485 [Phalaenopsis equestris]